MRQLVKLSTIFLGLFLVYFNLIANAAPTIGQALWVKGTLKATQPAGEPRVLARRSPIYEHDQIMSDPGGTGEIVFTDNSTLSLQENSTIRLDQYKYGGGTAPSSDAFVVSVVKGGFRTITGAISKNNPAGYQTNTPVGTIGVQGTQYSVYYSPKKGLASKIDRGKIVIKNDKGEVTLTKCDKPDKKNKQVVCKNQLYAQITSASSAPVVVAEQPAVFNSEPPLTPSTTGTGPTETPGPGGTTIWDNFNLNNCT